MSDDSPTVTGASNVLLNQRSLTAPYHREAVGIQGDENQGKALGFDATGRLAAIPVSGSVTSVRDFGAVGDGIADDTVAIQAAIDAGPCYLPQGTWKITTLQFPSNAVLRGAGRAAVLKSSVSGATAIIRNKTGVAGATTGVEISSLTIQGTDGNGGTGLWMDSWDHALISNVWIDTCRNAANLGRGLYMCNNLALCYNNTFSSLRVSNCDDAVVLEGTSAAGVYSCGYNSFFNLWIDQEINGVRLLKGTGNGAVYNRFYGFSFQGNTGPGTIIYSDSIGSAFYDIILDAVGPAAVILNLVGTAAGNQFYFLTGFVSSQYTSAPTTGFNTVNDSTGFVHALGKGYVFNDSLGDHKSYFRGTGASAEVELNLGNSSGDLWRMAMTSAASNLRFLDSSQGDYPLTLMRGANGPADFRRPVVVHNMTKAARNALGAVDNGTIIYQTDNTPGLRVREAGVWVRYTSTADA